MNANHRVGGDEEAGVFLDPSAPKTLSETIYVGRASFRMALDENVVLPPVADASAWFTPPPSNVMAGAPGCESGEDFLPSEPIVGEVAVGGRSWRWVKPTSWIIVGLPLVAFSLGMLVSPLASSSRISGLRASVSGAAGARTTAAPLAGVVAASKPPLATALVVAPMVAEVVPHTPPVTTYSETQTQSGDALAPPLAHGHALKVRAFRKAGGRERSSSQDAAGSVARRATSRAAAEREDGAPSPAGPAKTKTGKTSAAKPWVDPWAS